MKMNTIGRSLILCGALAASFALSVSIYSALPCFAEETEQETGTEFHGNTSVDYEDGIMTISIEATDHDDPDLKWEYDQGDKGDASLVELVAESASEEGFSYVGSFRGIEDGEDTIRLIHTDDFYTEQYMDFNVKIEDGNLTETTGGSYAFPVTADDLLTVIGGTWQSEDDPDTVLEISKADAHGMNFTVSFAGEDEEAFEYKMTVYFDAILNAMIYRDGTSSEKAVTDGTGHFMFDPESEDETDLAVLWSDDTLMEDAQVRFVRAA